MCVGVLRLVPCYVVVIVLLIFIKKIIIMSNLEEKAKLHKVAVSCFVDELEINRIKQAVELIITTSENSYKTGYLECQKEYEEKLRWIPIEEKEPPTDLILMKLSNGEIRLGHFLSKMSTSSGIFVNVTHFRNLFL